MNVLLDEYCHKNPLFIDPNPKYIVQSEKGDREREREKKKKKKRLIGGENFPTVVER